VTGPFPKNMMSCNVVKNAQMLIIGGSNSNATTYECDVDSIWGTHNMNLAKEDPEHAIWAAYQPSLTTYAVPNDITAAVGGNGEGQATMTAPPTGFDAPDLAVLATRKAKPATRTPTRPIPSATQPSSPPKKKLGKGALAGIVVGAIVGALLIGFAAFCLFRHLRRDKPQRTPELPGQPPMQQEHYQHQQSQQPHYYDAHSPGIHQYGTSPTLTNPSYIQPPPQAAAPVSELPASGAGTYSSEQAYYEQNRGFSPGAKSTGSQISTAYHARHMSHELGLSPREGSPTATAGTHSPYPESFVATPVGFEGYSNMDAQGSMGYHQQRS
jgi:hypothetical protein